MTAMINLKWVKGTASGGEIMGRGKTSETRRDLEVEKNGESSKKVTSAEKSSDGSQRNNNDNPFEVWNIPRRCIL